MAHVCSALVHTEVVGNGIQKLQFLLMVNSKTKKKKAGQSTLSHQAEINLTKADALLSMRQRFLFKSAIFQPISSHKVKRKSLVSISNTKVNVKCS